MVAVLFVPEDMTWCSVVSALIARYYSYAAKCTLLDSSQTLLVFLISS